MMIKAHFFRRSFILSVVIALSLSSLSCENDIQSTRSLSSDPDSSSSDAVIDPESSDPENDNDPEDPSTTPPASDLGGAPPSPSNLHSSQGPTGNIATGPSSVGKLVALKEYTETFTPKEIRMAKPPIRMLWLVDNSGSMLDDKQAVSNGITSFTHALSTFQNVDIKITFISKMHENDRNLQNHGITVDPTSINSVNALIIAERYLTGTGRGFFTGTTMNIIVVVTDDCTMRSAADFQAWLKRTYGNLFTFRFFGFIDTQWDAQSAGGTDTSL